jgi:hypothetical protein
MHATQATMERTTTEPACGEYPSVTYDQASSRITATLVVSLPAGSEEPSVEAPMIALPATKVGASPWMLVWRLHPDPASVVSAHFEPTKGVQLPGAGCSTPLGVEVGLSERGPQEDHWHVAIENHASSTSEFKYDVSVCAHPIFATIGPIQVTVHDPTIVVTPDPIDS